MFNIKIANLVIGIDNHYNFIEKKAKDYITEEEAEFTVSAKDEELEEEKKASGYNFPKGYLEFIVIYRHIAEILPSKDAFVFHGSIISKGGKAYAITAHSGVGKTTHTRLWLKRFKGEAHVLNGDKPIIRFIDGKIYACGTPWKGKEDYGVNEMQELAGIAFLERGETNSARTVEGKEVVDKIFNQIYTPKNYEALIKTMELCDKLLKRVHLVSLKCNMDIEACDVAYKELTGETIN